MYDTEQEAKQKLGNTIVLLNDQPVHISNANGNGSKLHLDYFDYRTGVEGRTSIKDKGWEFRNLGSRLGYTNAMVSSYHEALYLTRMPIRKSIQGLNHYNVSIPDFNGSERLNLPKARTNWQSIVNGSRSWFADTMERRYPSISSIEKDFERNPLLTSKAFHQKLALKRVKVGPIFLEYRGKDIGYTEDFERYTLSSDFSHLRETLEDMIGLRIIVK